MASIAGQWWQNLSLARADLSHVLAHVPLLAGCPPPPSTRATLLLHASVALAVCGFARDFFAEAAGLPPDTGAAARRFVVGNALRRAPAGQRDPQLHPRPRHRAREFVHAVLTAYAVLRWRRRGHWRWLAAAAAAILAATFSKEVGIVIAGGTAILVGFGVRPPEATAFANGRAGARNWSRRGFDAGLARRFISRACWPPCLTGVVLHRLGSTLSSGTVGHALWQSLHDIRLPWHLLTEARVFWMYAWRVVLPIRLCSDHQIAWTVSASDRIAWLAAAGVVAVLAGTVVLWCRARTRPAALLLALTLLAVLHRLANVSGELMVEYRMYPAMLFLCILLAWGLERLPARSLILGLLVTAGAGLSILRARDWRSPDTLAANIVAQYPLQARARQELQEADIRAERWPAVVSEQAGIRRALDGVDAFNRSQPLRWYDPSLAALTRVDSERQLRARPRTYRPAPSGVRAFSLADAGHARQPSDGPGLLVGGLLRPGKILRGHRPG